MPALRIAQLSEDASDIAREIHRRMLAKELGQKALAKLAGVNETYLRDLFSGRSKNPMTGHLQKVAAALGCRLEDLTGPTAVDPRLREFIKPGNLGPLRPSEVGLVWLWRNLDPASRDQILNHATALLSQIKQTGT